MSGVSTTAHVSSYRGAQHLHFQHICAASKVNNHTRCWFLHRLWSVNPQLSARMLRLQWCWIKSSFLTAVVFSKPLNSGKLVIFFLGEGEADRIRSVKTFYRKSSSVAAGGGAPSVTSNIIPEICWQHALQTPPLRDAESSSRGSAELPSGGCAQNKYGVYIGEV